LAGLRAARKYPWKVRHISGKLDANYNLRRSIVSSNIIDHVGLVVSNYARSKAFYIAALAPLGVDFLMEFGPNGGLGRDNKPDFWLAEKQDGGSSAKAAITPVHICFAARSRAEVDAFYRAALSAGGKDNGAPGIRAQYHPNYYGAFVFDFDGHNVEAVFHGPA
jgi:catechol 2,3-dioxygenase-like lactoylglutathione lyase family enzyme